MSGAEKSTRSREDCEHCVLCGAVDTKFHRVHTCEALETVREDKRELLATVAGEFTHLLQATEHSEAPLFRLACQTRALPPSLPGILGQHRLQVFTDGSAMFSSIPVARLMYWSVVASTVTGTAESCAAWLQRPLAERALAFRVVVQGCTPGYRLLCGLS